jgi:DNA-binding CsgD family transcriptional regulator
MLQLFNRIDAVTELKLPAERLKADLEQRLDRTQQTRVEVAAGDCTPEIWLRELVARPFVQPPVTNTAPTFVQTSGVQVQATEETLSLREVDVLRMVAAGANYAEIAQQLVISRHTVKTNVAHILAKLGAIAIEHIGLQQIGWSFKGESIGNGEIADIDITK